MLYKQCTHVRAKVGFRFVNPQTKRKVTITEGTILWVSNTTVSQSNDGYVMLTRLNQPMGFGWAFSPDAISTYFDVMERAR